MKSYGRAPTFLFATGHKQVRSIGAHFDSGRAAASTVALTVPATAVYSASLSSTSSCSGATSEGPDS